MSARKPLMELLIVTCNEKDKQNLIDLINFYTSLTLNFASAGSLENIQSFWNFDLIEQQTLISIIPANKTKEILSKIESQLNLKEKHQGIAFTIPFDSASSGLVKLFDKEKKLWKPPLITNLL